MGLEKFRGINQNVPAYVLSLYVIGYIILTVANSVLLGGQLFNTNNVENRVTVYDQPDHGYHYDLEVSTYRQTYYVDFVTNRVFTDSLKEEFTFQTATDMRAWIANRTYDEAVQVQVLFSHYKYLVGSNSRSSGHSSKGMPIHPAFVDSTNEEILNVLNDINALLDTTNEYDDVWDW